ncbi:MAG: hypothetical protein AAF992_10275 [Bacteroidota bacterium]
MVQPCLDENISLDVLDVSGLIPVEASIDELVNRIEVVQCYEKKYDGTIMWQNWRLVHGTATYIFVKNS